jgi:uncharacterized protein YdhG (YjbR/CyaY superfamily)
MNDSPLSGRRPPPTPGAASTGTITQSTLLNRETLVGMPSNPVDRYLATLDQPKRATLEKLRRTILEILPDAEETVSYGMPAYKVNGKTIAGFAAFKNHVSYLPHSGSVLAVLADDLGSYECTKGSLHFPVDQPLPRDLVRRLLRTRLTEAGLSTGFVK